MMPDAGRVRQALRDRLDGPGVARHLDAWHRAGRLSVGLAAEFVAEAWDLCPWPMRVLSRERWLALFRWAGYSNELRPAPRPTLALRLYRGSDPAGGEGLCWSVSLDVARWMASRFAVGMVWSAVVEPWRLLAFLDEEFEQQYVVDTTGLVAEVVAGPDATVGWDIAGLERRLEEKRAAWVPSFSAGVGR